MTKKNQSPCSSPQKCSPTGKEWCVGKCQKLTQDQKDMKKFVDSLKADDLHFASKFYKGWGVLKLHLFHPDHGEIKFDISKKDLVKHVFGTKTK